VKGFPNKEMCLHGVPEGEICVACAGTLNHALKVAFDFRSIVEKLALCGVDARLLSETMELGRLIEDWATDRDHCFASLGLCACRRCTED